MAEHSGIGFERHVGIRIILKAEATIANIRGIATRQESREGIGNGTDTRTANAVTHLTIA